MTKAISGDRELDRHIRISPGQIIGQLRPVILFAGLELVEHAGMDNSR
jgi:hypothetical protein